MSTDTNTLVMAPPLAVRSESHRARAWAVPAGGTAVRVPSGCRRQIDPGQVGNGGEPCHHVADLVRAAGGIGTPQFPGQLADLLDHPPERPVQATGGVSIKVGPSDSGLKLGELHSA